MASKIVHLFSLSLSKELKESNNRTASNNGNVSYGLQRRTMTKIKKITKSRILPFKIKVFILTVFETFFVLFKSLLIFSTVKFYYITYDIRTVSKVWKDF